jgi:hypothetical protein
MKYIKDIVKTQSCQTAQNQIYDRVDLQVYLQVENLTCDFILRQMEYEIWKQVSDHVFDQISEVK